MQHKKLAHLPSPAFSRLLSVWLSLASFKRRELWRATASSPRKKLAHFSNRFDAHLSDGLSLAFSVSLC